MFFGSALREYGVDDLIEGVIFCDYGNPKFSCKPEPQFYLDVRTRCALRT